MKSTFTGNTMAPVNTPARAREYMFSLRTPEALVVSCVPRFQQESLRALYVDMLFRDLPRPELVTAPMLVLGAGADGTISTEEVRATARAYHTAPEFFSDMGHDMMLEPGWAAVAERVHAWLDARDLRSDRGEWDQQVTSQ